MKKISILNPRNYWDHHWNEWISKSFIASFVIVSIFYFYHLKDVNKHYILNFFDHYSSTIISLAGALIAASLAGLSVFIVVVNKEALDNEKLLMQYLYPFLVNVYIWSGVTLLTILYLFADFSSTFMYILTEKSILFSLFLFLTLSGIFYTIDLVRHVLKTAIESI